MVTKTELYLDVLQSVMACLPLLLIFLFTRFPVLPEHPSLNSCLLNELYVVFTAKGIGVANITLWLTLLSMWPWTFWSSSSLGTVSKYTFYSSLFLDERTWSRQWTPGQIWIQCVLSLPIKQTGYGFRRSPASKLRWVIFHLYSLLARLLSSLESSSWSGMLKSWRGSRGGAVKDLEHMAYKNRLRELCLLSLMERRQRSDPTAACDYCQGSYEDDRAKCFCPDGKIKCHGHA